MLDGELKSEILTINASDVTVRGFSLRNGGRSSINDLAGIRVESAARASYLGGCVDVVVAARAAPGCIDFHLSADPIEPGRINVFEQWATVAAVEAFRGSGPSDDQQDLVLGAHVEQHEVASTIALT